MASVRSLIFSLLVCVLSLLLLTVMCATKSYLPKGRLIEPPPRLSLWRYGYNTPKYNQDNELSCIRKAEPRQCGLCGETSVVAKNLQISKSAENSVKIVRTYLRGQKIKVGVLLITPTVHHGWFQFELCPKCTTFEQETETCFRKHVLKVLSMSRVDPSQPIEVQMAKASDNILTEEESLSEQIDEREHTKGLYSIPSDLPPDTVLVIEIQLPSDVFCDTCVLRWKYFAGKHKKLYGCADVKITASPDQSKNLQWVNADCMPENAVSQLEHAEKVVVVHRRDQSQSNTIIPTLKVVDSTMGPPDFPSVKRSHKRGEVKDSETKGSLNGYYPYILSQIANIYPHVHGQKLEVRYDFNLTDSIMKQTDESPDEYITSLAARNLNLPSSLCFFFFICFFSFITFLSH